MPVEQFRSFESTQRISCGRELTGLLHGGHILLMKANRAACFLCAWPHSVINVRRKTAQQNAGAYMHDRRMGVRR